MRTVLYDAPLFAWPVGMGAMMWFMGRGMRGARARGACRSPSCALNAAGLAPPWTSV
jgi:hypothetical protein